MTKYLIGDNVRLKKKKHFFIYLLLSCFSTLKNSSSKLETTFKIYLIFKVTIKNVVYERERERDGNSVILSLMNLTTAF